MRHRQNAKDAEDAEILWVVICFLCVLCVLCVPSAVKRVSALEPLFLESAAETGLVFTHVNGAADKYYLPEVMGAGVALFDYDNDGDLDVFLVQGGPLSAAAVSSWPTSKLFRNDLTSTGGKPVLKFTDVTATAHAGVHGYGMGAAVGDYDNDGFLDLLITAFGGMTLLHNNGDGTFADATEKAGLNSPPSPLRSFGGQISPAVSSEIWRSSAAFVDYDRDGNLDLFVATYVDFTIAGNKLCNDSVGARDYCGPRSFRPVPSHLYRNNGDGTFADVTERAGISKAYGAGLGVSVGDYNGDGWPDLYVANDATPNQLWINHRDGTFVDEGLLSGSAVNAAGNPEGSVGIASGDFDLDGDEDLFVTNIAGETFVLYVNDGKGNFEDARARYGIAAPTAAFTGFGTDWFDYDNDGWPDLFVANGGVNVIEAQRGQPAPFRMVNQLFHNGLRSSSVPAPSLLRPSSVPAASLLRPSSVPFEDVSSAAGPAFARAEISRGAAFGDIDNDGDVDVVFTNNGGPVRLLLNQVGNKNHWLQIRLDERPANRFGIGAWVGVERRGQPTLWRRVRTDGSYLSASDVRLHFGLGSSTAIDAVTVQWPDSTRERFTGITADKVITLRRGAGGPERAALRPRGQASTRVTAVGRAFQARRRSAR